MRKILGRGEETAITGKDIHLTYDELLQQVSYYSSVLGDVARQRVVIFSENRHEWIYALYAILKNKGIAVPVDAMSTAGDLAYIIKDCRPHSVFISADKTAVLKEAMAASDHYPTVCTFENLNKMEGEATGEEIVVTDEDDTALILYTSGTTGSPKGVMLSFANIFVNLDGVCHDVPIYNPDDRVMVLLPVHHVFSLIGTLVAPLYVHAILVLNHSLAADEMIATLQRHKVTIMIAVPRLYQLLYKGLVEKIRHNLLARMFLGIAGVVRSKKLSLMLFGTVHRKFGGHIRYMVTGGAALDAKVVRFFVTLGFEILEGYGMTETAPMISFTRPGKIRPGIPGQPLKGVNIETREGEIVVSGKNVMQGYYNKPAETAEVLKDGWLYTGDLGFVDEKGYVNITGRKKEIIVLSNGKNINPAELEASIINDFDEVKECGVFMKDDALQVIILPDFKKLGDKGIKDYEQYIKWNVIDVFNKTVTPYKKILRFHITAGELPKTRLGKLKRFTLETLATQRKESVEDEPRTNEYQALKRFLEEETKQSVHPHHHLELDLALDSLGRVSLSAFIETAFGVTIPESNLPDYSSVQKLAEFISQKKTRLSFEGINWSKILMEKVHISLPQSWFTHNLFKSISRAFFRTFLKLRGEGLENLPESSCIIAPNHQSVLDGFLVVSFFKRKLMKKTYVYAKEQHFRNRLMRFLANRNNIILVDINKDLKLSIQKLAEVLRKGKNLIIFPEGTRTLNGKIGDFKQTFAILSKELNIPIVPVAIQGSYDILPSGSRFLRLFRKVTISFLTPVYPGNHTYESLKDKVYQQVAGKLGNG